MFENIFNACVVCLTPNSIIILVLLECVLFLVGYFLYYKDMKNRKNELSNKDTQIAHLVQENTRLWDLLKERTPPVVKINKGKAHDRKGKGEMIVYD